jgi:hypothetical protein
MIVANNSALPTVGYTLPGAFATSVKSVMSQSQTSGTALTNNYNFILADFSQIEVGTPPVIVVLPVLNVQFSTPNLTLSWTDATYSLQTAPEVTGTYVTLTGVTSPFTTNITSNARLFFRLIK